MLAQDAAVQEPGNDATPPPTGDAQAIVGKPATPDALPPASSDVSDAAVPFSDAASWDAGAGEPPPTGESLYPQVQAIVRRSCSFDRCHNGIFVGAGLYFGPDMDARDALVNVTACEYDRMARVAPGDPEHSWIWIKLTAPFRPQLDPYATYIEFEPPADWDRSVRGCPDETDTGVPLFGQRMPATAPNSLPKEELSVIRRWIEQGAPP